MTASVIEFANTFVGKPGNIGMRTAKVLRHIAESGGHAACICRGAVSRNSSVQYIEMGWLGHVPRFLNAVRIYLAPSFNHRLLDIALFERYAGRQLDRFLDTGSYEVAHVWDTCPQLIRRLKALGMRVILDVPIAPLAYSSRM